MLFELELPTRVRFHRTLRKCADTGAPWDRHLLDNIRAVILYYVGAPYFNCSI